MPQWARENDCRLRDCKILSTWVENATVPGGMRERKDTGMPRSSASPGSMTPRIGGDMARTAVELHDVGKIIGQHRVLDRVSLRVQPGEFFALLGPSGCGKTTTLRLIAGFDQPTSGAILINGQPMAGLPPYRRDVNMVFQNYALFPHLTVFQNIAFGLEMQG